MSFFPDTYFERSPSGIGLRGFFRLSPDFAYDKTVYYINNRKHGLEVYLPGVTNRFVTVTGDVYRTGTVSRNDEALQSALDTFMRRSNRLEGSKIEPCSYLTDEQVIAHAMNSESGEKFKALYEGNWEEGYDSQSDADMALVSILAFWCGNVEEQIDRIFRSSGLMRDKWDRQTGDATYGQITIRNAVSTNSSIYIPIQDAASAEDDFEDLDEEEQHAAFRPDLSHLTLTLEEMKPHTNPRYQREEIPFNRHFEEHEQDKGLKTTLTDSISLSGILNWAVEGYRLFKTEGLEPPEEVKSATAQYRQDSDSIAQFAESWLEEGKDEDGDKYEVPCKAVYRVYSRWCDDLNYHPVNYKNFRAAMEKMYMVKRKRPKAGGSENYSIAPADSVSDGLA